MILTDKPRNKTALCVEHVSAGTALAYNIRTPHRHKHIVDYMQDTMVCRVNCWLLVDYESPLKPLIRDIRVVRDTGGPPRVCTKQDTTFTVPHTGITNLLAVVTSTPLVAFGVLAYPNEIIVCLSNLSWVIDRDVYIKLVHTPNWQIKKRDP